MVLDGFYGDSAITVPVGQVSDEARPGCVEVTRAGAGPGASPQARAGQRVGDLGAAVQACVEAQGFSVVRDFVGHGIGRRLHEPPQIPNFGTPGTGPRLKAGMVLAIEPMVNAGWPRSDLLEDGWTAVTADGRLSAHFEHTVAVTENGPEILTLPQGQPMTPSEARPAEPQPEEAASMDGACTGKRPVLKGPLRKAASTCAARPGKPG